MLDRIDRDIELTGDLTEEQRAKLLEIADKCPVHRTLTRGMQIDSTAGLAMRADSLTVAS